MTRKYSLVIEGGPGSYSAYVPELPAIVVAGESLDEITGLATEAIHHFWTETHIGLPPAALLREIEVEFPA